MKLPQVAIDPEPVDLARAPRSVIVDRVIDDLATVRDTDSQSNLWIETGQVAESGEELVYESAKVYLLSRCRLKGYLADQYGATSEFMA